MSPRLPGDHGPLGPVPGPGPIGPRPPRPPFRPIPWSPFGPGDNASPDVGTIEGRAAEIRATLEKAQRELTGMRHGPGPDGKPPVLREATRADGLWPFLVVRTYPGDMGKRPYQSSDTIRPWTTPYNSPDVILASPGLAGEPAVIDRTGVTAIKAREATNLNASEVYDVWVHVWNLGQFQASGVRVRARLGPLQYGGGPVPTPRYLGGITVDLGDRESATSHVLVKAATFTTDALAGNYWIVVTATAENLLDPGTGDLAPGADRHSAHCAIGVVS